MYYYQKINTFIITKSCNTFLSQHVRQILLKHLYFGLAIPQKNTRVLMAVLTGTVHDQFSKIANIFGRFYLG